METISKEMMKGNIDTILLALLKDKDLYGYELTKYVRFKTQNQYEMKEATLYLSLKRLEKKGLVTSYWGDEKGAGGRRKYYQLTKQGELEILRKKKEWTLMNNIMQLCFEGVDN
ncbi:PadR family transcriptional regulator (plasmid) [Alkalihalophilus sp. As8PL]|uniref:PadR family transcriptional regulator n=1 Tax=Alkalihalophilus sp. As8PL TaxID=3237103 RepID=A0AB39BNZ8_9BACI